MLIGVLCTLVAGVEQTRVDELMQQVYPFQADSKATRDVMARS